MAHYISEEQVVLTDDLLLEEDRERVPKVNLEQNEAICKSA